MNYYILWLLILLLMMKCIWNALVPIWSKYFDKNNTSQHVSMGLGLDLMLLAGILVFNIAIVLLSWPLNFFERYSFFILLITLILSYALAIFFAWIIRIIHKIQ